MAVVTFIYGKSGSGKSRSLLNFKEDEILLVNIAGKELPFRRKFTHTLNTDDGKTIQDELLKMKEYGIRTVVFDDFGYVQTHLFMRKHRDMKGNAQFDLYNEIADKTYRLIQLAKKLPDDVTVYFFFHEDTTDYGNTSLRTIGRLLDSKVCLEGLVTVCLRCMSDGTRHFFRTVTDGSDITKAPEGMFDGDEIPNDLKAVDEKVRLYYGI